MARGAVVTSDGVVNARKEQWWERDRDQARRGGRGKGRNGCGRGRRRGRGGAALRCTVELRDGSRLAV